MQKINVKKVSFHYDSSRNILNDVSFSVQTGERLAIIGANGCGKSTLLKIISGMIRPTQGEVLFNGQHTHENPFFFCSQNPFDDLFVNMSILENFFLWEKVSSTTVKKGAKSQYAQDLREYLLTLHSTLGNLNTLVEKLSGGEKQLLLLAFILRRSPRAILLDEHGSALDPNAYKEVMEKTVSFVKKLQLPMIMITHSLSDLKYATRFLAIKRGHIFINRETEKPLTQEEIKDLYQ